MSTQPLRPFHESIIEVIQHANGSQLVVLAELLKATHIPKNHDAIIAAWTTRRLDMHSLDYDVSSSLQTQKEREEFAVRLHTGC